MKVTEKKNEIRKFCGKRRKCKLPAFSPYPAIFSKGLILKVINPFPNKPWFLRVCCTSLLKTLWEKEKLLVTSNFSFSHSVFYPFRDLSAISIFIEIQIVVCKLFQFGRVQNLLFGKGLKVRSKEQDQTACDCMLILHCTLCIINP